MTLAPYLPTVISYAQAAAPIAALGALILSIFGLGIVLHLRRRLNRLALGRNGSIEESISILSRETKELQAFRAELEKYLKGVESRLRGAVQGVGIVRFNPFSGDGSGGNQSFAAAFLDEHNAGIVFSALWARDRVSVYAKPLEKGVSTFTLTEEEQKAIDKAKQSIAEHKKPTN